MNIILQTREDGHDIEFIGVYRTIKDAIDETGISRNAIAYNMRSNGSFPAKGYRFRMLDLPKNVIIACIIKEIDIAISKGYQGKEFQDKIMDKRKILDAMQ